MNKDAWTALGYSQITDLSASIGFTPLAKASTILVQCEAQNVRYRDDAGVPTSTVGMLMVANTIYEFTVAQMAQMRFIEVVGGAKLNVSQYGSI